jgi:hypothetical protein
VKLIEEVTRDWQWLTFLVQYCSGKNISKGFCEDVRWWVLGIAALLVLAVVAWIWGRIAKAYDGWNFRRLQARIADSETMKKHVWSGHDAHLSSSDQKAQRRPGK